MKLKIANDSHNIISIKIVRKHTGESIQQIKQKIERCKVVITCDYLDTEGLIRLKEIINELVANKSSIELFEEDEEISIDYLTNLIEKHQQISKNLQDLDDLRLAEEDE